MADDTTHLSATDSTRLRLEPAVNAIDDYYKDHPALQPQLAQTAVDSKTGTILIYWFGAIPDSMQSDLDVIAAPVQATVRIVPVPYDAAAIEQATIYAINLAVASTASYHYDSQTLVVGIKSDLPLEELGLPFVISEVPVRYHRSDSSPLATCPNTASP